MSALVRRFLSAVLSVDITREKRGAKTGAVARTAMFTASLCVICSKPKVVKSLLACSQTASLFLELQVSRRILSLPRSLRSRGAEHTHPTILF